VAEKEQGATEQATPYKLEEARKRGQVSRSMDFNSLVMGWAALGAVLVWGEEVWRRLVEMSRTVIAAAASPQADLAVYLAGIQTFVRWTLAIVLPVAAVALVLGVLGNLLQSGPVFSTEPLKPKLERINPVAGFQRLYSKRMLFEVFKNVLKLLFFTALMWFFFRELWPRLAELATPDVNGQAKRLADWSVALLVRLVLALTLIGLLDLLYQRWKYAQEMRMSRRELKEEVKRREGDPLIRAKVRELQRERLKQVQSVGRVPEADVLITNPTHLAVALKYVREEMGAPVVLAKGSETLADEMRRSAARHGIPIVHKPPLARRLYRRARVGDAIPSETFVEVARVYSTLDRRRKHAVQLEVQP
jgi:flagellar biosynthetic protein FlhB